MDSLTLSLVIAFILPAQILWPQAQILRSTFRSAVGRERVSPKLLRSGQAMMKACTALLGQCPRVSSTASRRACTTMFAGQANTVATRRGCRGALRAANPASTLANQRNRQRASGPTSSRPSSLRHNVRGIRGYVPGRLRQWCATQLAASADITWSSASIESKDQVGKDRCVVFGATTRPPATSGRRSAPPSSSPAAPSLTPPPFPPLLFP